MFSCSAGTSCFTFSHTKLCTYKLLQSLKIFSILTKVCQEVICTVFTWSCFSDCFKRLILIFHSGDFETSFYVTDLLKITWPTTLFNIQTSKITHQSQFLNISSCLMILSSSINVSREPFVSWSCCYFRDQNLASCLFTQGRVFYVTFVMCTQVWDYLFGHTNLITSYILSKHFSVNFAQPFSTGKRFPSHHKLQ